MGRCTNHCAIARKRCVPRPRGKNSRKESGPLWRSSSRLAFPSCTRFWTGPRRQGFASPRNNSAPLTAAGRSKRTPLSKRERLKMERDILVRNFSVKSRKGRKKEEGAKKKESIQTAELDRRDQVTATNSWPRFLQKGEQRSIIR